MRALQLAALLSPLAGVALASDCVLSPLGDGQDDTDQVLAAIDQCGTDGTVTLNEGEFNITRKMTWDLSRSRVDLRGWLSFTPDVEYWLDPENTYRVVFIQSQASWFVVTGSDFVIDAHNQGGINGNGQTWWNYFTNVTREDGDGRPLALTLYQVSNGTVKDFHIQAQPFWCNTVAESDNVVYDGMKCNATNGNPEFFGQNIVPNTDGINTYRSSNVQLLNWDITCGDDCLAIKGNSTNILANNVTCHGGNGIAFGSLGQYVNMSDIVDNVTLSNVVVERINKTLQPNMGAGVYLKTWTGTVNGEPPTGGGGGSGYVSNIRFVNFTLSDVDLPTHIYQTNGGHSADEPSTLQFSNITWENWTGTADGATLVNIACSSAVPCPDLTFINFDVSPPSTDSAKYECSNAVNVTGISC
ncbi:unnamed protein product [Peniophora sp. CBMAI 1063]|nr:unnamed protein product [Peniophora sp. CBMAI 1063]